MIQLYKVMVTILYPLLILLIYFRKLINKEDPIRFKEKIFPNSFKVKYSKDAHLIWFHAASIGELKSIFPINLIFPLKKTFFKSNLCNNSLVS